jgi:hypothetical protein
VRRSLVIALAVSAAALVGLAMLRSDAVLQPPFPRAQATDAAMRNPELRTFLASYSWTRARVIAFDQHAWRVTFFDGQRTVADAAVGPTGAVTALQLHPPAAHPPGSVTAWRPLLLLLFALAFVGSVAGRPLRSLRNLDAAVLAAGFALAALLLDARMVGGMIFVAAATLAYAVTRCAQTALRPAREPGTPLIEAMPLRLAALAAAALVVACLTVVLTSTNASDVAAANLAGATQLNDGVMPYGHELLAIHGDTYPLLSYVLYMPVAALSPLRDVFGSLDPALWLNAVALLIAAALAGVLGGRSYVLALLTFPGVLLAASSGSNDVPTAVFVLGALLAFGRPLLSAALWTLAGWVKIVPVAALVPSIAGQRHRLRGLAVVVAVVVAGIAPIALAGSVDDAWQALRFQFVRGSWFSIWQQLDARWLQVVFQALVLGAAAATIDALRRQPALDLRRSAALGGAFVALLQLGANYWSYTYLPWLLPLILVALFPSARRRSQPRGPVAP